MPGTHFVKDSRHDHFSAELAFERSIASTVAEDSCGLPPLGMRLSVSSPSGPHFLPSPELPAIPDHFHLLDVFGDSGWVQCTAHR